MEDHGSSDSQVSDVVDIARQSIRNHSDDDTVDSKSEWNVCSGQTQAVLTPTTPDNVLPSPGVSSDAEEYFMGNPERGVALIFSHEKFNDRGGCYQPPRRRGTEIDRNRLRHTFNNLGFKVLFFDDLSLYQIRNELRQVAKQSHENRDCIAVAVLSHGERDGMLDAWDCAYHISELWEPFTARCCPSLAGKPKLFFIQACRGRGADQGVMVRQLAIDAPDDGREAELVYPVPSYADIFVSYSTFEGLYSYRNPQNGSWYIQTLCSQLDDHGKTKDLVPLITDVNRIVGQGFRSHNEKNPQLHGMVQAPCFTSSLTRRLSFRQNSQLQRPSSSPDFHP